MHSLQAMLRKHSKSKIDQYIIAQVVKMRTEKGMTQEELAKKCGTTKSYISRIENNASDIRLSTLMKIIQQGLGGHLKLTLQL